MEELTKLDVMIFVLAVSDVSRLIFGTWYRGLAVTVELMNTTLSPSILTKLEKRLLANRANLGKIMKIKIVMITWTK